MVSKNNSLAGLKSQKNTTSLLSESQATGQGASSPAKRGAPPKPPEQKETFVLTIKLTEEEGQVLKDKAGLVRLATYVKAFLRTETDLLKP